MPLPTPKKGEKYRTFTSRFLKDREAKKKFPKIKQRFAVMASTWRESKPSSKLTRKQNLKIRRDLNYRTDIGLG